MKRIQGWGNKNTDYAVPEPAKRYLENTGGNPLSLKNVPIEDLLRKIPPSCLPSHPSILTDPEERLRHARGQSLPDWIDMFDGLINTFPDGVAYPATDAEVLDLIRFAKKHKVNLIPYGGGSSVVGHLTPLSEGPPRVSLDMT
ncbi:MAG: FAD-binding oxidoreductase, partial [Anaerolineales bacterium]